ncbi:MAG: tRNA (N(6)-L-threonylcarbamoyladenosine(37)-C(2))-methylthiotransferase MtaB [Angelakisella sp.]
MIRVCFYTLGCKVNQYETQALAQRFTAEGFLVCPQDEPAEVYIVNSCTVTAEGDRKVRQLLRRLRREHPDGVVALTGCYPQAFPTQVAALTGVDVITGSRDRGGLLRAVAHHLATGERVVSIVPHTKGEAFEAMSADDFGQRTRAFLKIEDGCENYCAYCIIPFARGPVRSKPMAQLADELTALATSGHREVVLAGINLSSYGRDTGHRLIDAVELACATAGIDRVRLGSLEPDLITPDDIERMSRLGKVCPQFHLSLQSGSDTVLARMGRHYHCADYLAVVEQIHACFPDATITTDLMVGFPGETEEEFTETLAFARRVGFAKIHVFAYSPREGTRAATMPEQLSGTVKKQRSHRLLAVAAALRQEFLSTLVGQRVQVLFEERGHDGSQTGYTKNYTPVSVTEPQSLQGQLQTVLITEAGVEGCFGVLAD